jgi:hypothetical protein
MASASPTDEYFGTRRSFRLQITTNLELTFWKLLIFSILFAIRSAAI